MSETDLASYVAYSYIAIVAAWRVKLFGSTDLRTVARALF